MNRKILIVDGSNLLFRMFFGMPSRIYNDNGVGIWGVLGFTGALLKILRQTQPSQYADFKSLTGAASDSIPGADKVGPKTAAALL